MMSDLALPTAEDTGQVRRWYLPLRAAGTQQDEFEYHVTYARFLGMGTSYSPVHAPNVPHPNGFVSRGVRCNACRWFEARVFREVMLPEGVRSLDELLDQGTEAASRVRLGGYVLHSMGMSVVDGEVPFCRVEETRSAFTVVELMTTRRVTDQGPQAFIAKPAAHALSEAASSDPQLADAYINRAVS